MKYFLIFILTSSLCYLPSESDKSFSQTSIVKQNKQMLYFFVGNVLQTCKLNPKKILAFDNDYTEGTFRALAEIHPKISVSLFTNITAWNQLRRYQFNDLRVDAVILIIDFENPWYMIQRFFYEWRFNRDCIVFVFPVPLDDCDHYEGIFELIMRFYFPVVYYVCLMDNRYIRVYTHDPYGDTQPPYWKKIDQELNWGKNWTFYGRSYKKDMRELCPGFNFERTNPSNIKYVILGLFPTDIKRDSVETTEEFYGDYIENYLRPQHQSYLNNLKRLLNVRFNYYMIKSTVKGSRTRAAHESTSIDTFIFNRQVMSFDFGWNYFHPTAYESLAIISHDRGLMTPLEKIGKYYGVWTLSSLIVLIIITFIVIWRTTKKLSSAFFDIVRLLINTGIFVPINTRPLKIFLSMIFLYFLIIHATFSGHLAEFLTKADRRHNVETLDDLKDPRIEKIYRFGYRYDDAKEFDILRQKTEFIERSYKCKNIISNPHSACLAPLPIIHEIMLKHNLNVTLHMSKNTFGISLMSHVYRPGFPLRERFNWAWMFLFDTNIINKDLVELKESFLKSSKKQTERTHIGYRSITVDDIDFAFFILITGNCLGIICFLFELKFKNICKWFENRQPVKKRNIVSIVVQHN